MDFGDLHLTTAAWMILFVSAFFTTVSKTGIPGVGILGIVAALFAMPDHARSSVGVLLPMLIAGDVIAVWYYKQHAVWRHIWRLGVPWAVAGVVIGWLVLGKINDSQLKFIVGLIIFGLLVLEEWRNRRPNWTIHRNLWFAAMVGVLAGVTTMLGNAAGPLTVIFFLAMGLSKHEFVGTSAWYFLLLNCFKVPFMWNQDMISWHTLQINVVLLPAVVAGAFAGIFLFKRISQRAFVVTVKVLAGAGAVVLVVMSVMGR